MTEQPSRATPKFTPTEKAFLLTMYRAGLASSTGWLTKDQLDMAEDLDAKLDRLPAPTKGKKLEPKAPGTKNAAE